MSILKSFRRKMYNLIEDPEELRDLYTSEPDLAAALQNELLERLQTADGPYDAAS